MSETAVLDLLVDDCASAQQRIAEEPAEAWQVTEIIRMGRSAVAKENATACAYNVAPVLNWETNSETGLMEAEIVNGSTLCMVSMDPDARMAVVYFAYAIEDEEDYKEFELTAPNVRVLMRAVSERMKREFAAVA